MRRAVDGPIADYFALVVDCCQDVEGFPDIALVVFEPCKLSQIVELPIVPNGRFIFLLAVKILAQDLAAVVNSERPQVDKRGVLPCWGCQKSHQHLFLLMIEIAYNLSLIVDSRCARIPGQINRAKGFCRIIVHRDVRDTVLVQRTARMIAAQDFPLVVQKPASN